MTMVPPGDFGSWIGGKLFCQASPPFAEGVGKRSTGEKPASPFFWRGGIKSEKSLQKSTKHVPWDVVEWRCNW